jgi:CheY-like chemotaxis protein
MRTCETILVVEDADEVRRMICQILLQHGYNVLEAANGVQALEVSASYSSDIHLVLTDIMMPHMNGHELAVHIERRLPATRLIFMSGYPEDPVSRQPGRLRVFLAKPFTPVALTKMIREVLDGPGHNPEPTR